MPCPILEFIMGEKLKNKQTKTTLVFILQKYGKFWSVLEGHFIKHTPSDSEKCFTHFTNKRPMEVVLCFVYLERYSALNFFKVWKKWFKFEKKYWFLVFWVQTTEEKKEKLGQEMQQCALIKVLVTLEEMFAPFDRTKEITNN